jgi:uncharacterized protein YbaR (Trm112 family)
MKCPHCKNPIDAITSKRREINVYRMRLENDKCVDVSDMETHDCLEETLYCDNCQGEIDGELRDDIFNLLYS